MFSLYLLIQEQVQTLVDSIYTNQYGVYDYGGVIASHKALNILVNVLTMIFFILVVLLLGLFLWNQGLASVVHFVEPIGEGRPKQLKNSYLQLFISLLAIGAILG